MYYRDICKLNNYYKNAIEPAGNGLYYVYEGCHKELNCNVYIVNTTIHDILIFINL